MTFWDGLSVVALAAASIPSIYFAAKIRGRHPVAARLSAFLAGALLVHASYHLLVVLEFPQTLVLAVEATSAVLILVYALLYWRERGVGG